MSIEFPPSAQNDADDVYDKIVEASNRFITHLRKTSPPNRAGDLAERLIKQFPSRLQLEAMFITLAQMWGLAHSDTMDEHLEWLRDVMERGTNQVYNHMKAEAIRKSNLINY